MAASTSVTPRGRLRYAVPLAPYTSWHVGGPADVLFEPADRADLLIFLAEQAAGTTLLWLGLGSNLLVRDGGVRATVIVLHGRLNGLRLEDDGADDATDRVIHAEAGVHCARLAKFAERRALAGIGFMNGIPGTLGGALAMNAGAFGSETWDHVVAVEAAFAGGITHWLEPTAFHIAYRSVTAPDGVLGFLGARLRVQADDGSHREATRAALAQRKATQPVGRASGGSTFRNPPGDHAARLIETAGLKGFRIGGAEVSARHANFIINDGTASAADIEALIAHVGVAVRAHSGVRLEPEVRIVGEPLVNTGGAHA